jgi:hypothetical protein
MEEEGSEERVEEAAEERQMRRNSEITSERFRMVVENKAGVGCSLGIRYRTVSVRTGLYLQQ